MRRAASWYLPINGGGFLSERVVALGRLSIGQPPKLVGDHPLEIGIAPIQNLS
jgi:hypothetical protein